MKKKRMFLFAVGVVLTGILAYQFIGNSPAEAQSGSRYGAGQGGARQANRPFETQFWDYLQEVQYKNWAPVPGQSGDSYPGESPHGAFLKMYLNRTAAGDMKNLPHGSILIKENYGKDKKTLMAVTVMYRYKGYNPEGRDWYWLKYNPDGTVAKAPPKMGSMPLKGKVKGCIMCHDGADGKDFAFVNDQK